MKLEKYNDQNHMYLSKIRTSINTNGSLRIVMRENSTTSIVHVKSWKDGLGMELIQGKREDFHFMNTESTILNKAHNKKLDLPIHRFINEIPSIYSEAAGEYIHLQHLALRVFRFHPKSYDLFKSNKPLFDLILYNHQSLCKTGRLISIKQHKIVESLYPKKTCTLSYKSLTNLLKKIASTYDKKSMQLIDNFMRRTAYSKLQYKDEKTLPHINIIPLCFLEKGNIELVFRFTPSLFNKSTKDHYRLINNISYRSSIHANQRYALRAFVGSVHDMYSMANKLKIPQKEFEHKLFNSKTKDAVERYHDNLLVKLRRRIGDTDNVKNDIKFDKPPISGTREINPITNYSGLIKEGDELNHCVGHARYDELVLSGQSYIYSIKTEFDRCTLELRKRKGGNFYIHQLQGNSNSTPNIKTRELVNNWIALNNKTGYIQQ